MTIVKDDEFIGGKARIEGSRVSAEQVYEMHKLRGMKPEKIAKALPTISLKEVKEAIKYMKDRKEDVSPVSAGAKA